MAIVDMPLEELELYKGINPCPTDMDQYWKDAESELKSTPPDTDIQLSEFQTDFAQCNHLYFNGVGGARIHAKFLLPKKVTSKCPALLVFHGYSASSGDWCEYLSYVASGFAVAAMDCRGQGGQSNDSGPHKGPTLYGQIIRGLQGGPEKLF